MNGRKDDSRTVDDFSEWVDFPKGMRVLLLDDDDLSASKTSSELQQLDYTVTRFRNEDEALEAVAIKTDAFHVAIVEVNTSESHESFRFLQMARGLPIIMISNVQCLTTMMKCIALGAAEFLKKPLSEDKLRNIWQHAVHKAFNAGQDDLSKSLKPIKETVASMFRLQTDEAISEVENRQNLSQQSAGDDGSDDQVTKCMFAEAPSTPQQTSQSPDAGDVQAQAMDNQDIVPANERLLSFSRESKSVHHTCIIANGEDVEMKKEVKDACPNPKECLESPTFSHHLNDEANAEETSVVIETIKTNALSDHHLISDCKSKKKSMKKETKVAKVDWTPELHRRFVQAVEQLGIYEAIPSKILEHMKVEGLTRHNVASHLQKYRMHRRHVLPQQQREQQHVSKFYLQNPCVGFPPNYHHQVYHHHHRTLVWGHPAYNHQIWAPHDTGRYQPSPRIWPWKSFARMNADNWGCPVVVPEDNMLYTQHKFGRNRFYGAKVEEQKHLPPRNLYDDLYVEEEVIDEVVKEAMRKPWLPLPLGLKPPSIDAVLAELQSQGIRAIPPPTH